MFQVLTDKGVIIGYIDEPLYIKVSDNGSFIQTTEEDALGIAIQGIPYHLYGRDELPNVTTNVFVNKVDSGIMFTTEINKITPYTESKTVYIEDTEVIFNNVPNGNLTIFMIDKNNQSIPFTYERNNDQVRVSFEQRQSLATVTINVL